MYFCRSFLFCSFNNRHIIMTVIYKIRRFITPFLFQILIPLKFCQTVSDGDTKVTKKIIKKVIRNVETVGPTDKTVEVTRVENVQRNFFKEEELRMQVSRGIRSDLVPNIVYALILTGYSISVLQNSKLNFTFCTIAQIKRMLKYLKNKLKLVVHLPQRRLCETITIYLS